MSSPSSILLDDREQELRSLPNSSTDAGLTLRSQTRLAWVSEVTVDVHRFAFSDGSHEKLEYSSPAYEWQGLQWGLSLLVNNDDLDVNVYVQRLPGSVIQSLTRNIAVRFYLVDHENRGRTTKSKQTDHHQFTFHC